MKKSEFVQVKGLDLKELRIKVKALRSEIANLVLDKNMKKLKDLKMILKKRKELAQILTVIRQKELLVQLEARVQKDSENSENQNIGESENQTSGTLALSDTSDRSGILSPSGRSGNAKRRVRTGGKK